MLKKNFFILFSILIILFLYLLQIAYLGIGGWLWPDERYIQFFSLYFWKNYNLGEFIKSPPVIIIMAIINAIIFLFLKIMNITYNLSDFAAYSIINSDLFTYAGRCFSILSAFGVIFYSYKLLKKYLEIEIVLITILFLFASYSFIWSATIYKEDMFAFLILVIFLYYLSEYLDKNNIKYLFIASFISGFSLGVKQNNLIIIIDVFIVLIIFYKKINLKNIFYVLFFLFFGLLVGDPYLIFSIKDSIIIKWFLGMLSVLFPAVRNIIFKIIPTYKTEFFNLLSSYKFQHFHIGESGDKWQSFISSISFQSFNSIIFYFGFLVILFFTIKFFIELLKNHSIFQSKTKYIILLLHIYFYLLFFLKYEVKEFRYLFPILLFIFSFAAIGICKIANILKIKTKFILLLVLLLAIHNLYKIYNAIYNERIPYVNAQSFIKKNIPQNSNILADNMYIPNILFRYEINQKKIEKLIPYMKNKNILKDNFKISLFTTPISLREDDYELQENNFKEILDSDHLKKIDYIIVSKSLYGRFFSLNYPETQRFYNYIKENFNCVFQSGDIYIYKIDK
ncbi:MAG TPA: glycosyltransferase family 39 protein [bacterium]|nr:glycosyltransferase family 39 protein [bacterium]HOL48422.1 glycosyltransferase family 39 protein [bacterium]HPQ19455.1 glycosyltransferase family 39 protein [bacterium]